MFRGICSQFPPFNPPTHTRTHAHTLSLSFTFIYYPRPPSDKAKRVFQNDYKARQVSKMYTFIHILYMSFYLTHIFADYRCALLNGKKSGFFHNFLINYTLIPIYCTNSVSITSALYHLWALSTEVSVLSIKSNEQLYWFR